MTGKKRGLVMSIFRDGEVTVMTPQGEFLNIPWSHSALPEVGSEIEFVLPVVRRSFFRQKYFIALAASLVLFLLATPLWTGLLLPGPQQVVAYISVDINPSIEIGINYQGKVVEAAGLNDDGVKLLQNLDLAKLPVSQAIRLITAEAVKENYLAPDKENTVLITVSSRKKLPEQVKNLERQVKEVLEQKNISAQAESIEIPVEIREKAKKEKVSPGKYVILMEAVDQGLNLTLEDVKGSSIVKAVKEAGGIPGQLISKAKKDRNKIKEIHNRFEKKVNREGPPDDKGVRNESNQGPESGKNGGDMREGPDKKKENTPVEKPGDDRNEKGGGKGNSPRNDKEGPPGNGPNKNGSNKK